MAQNTQPIQGDNINGFASICFTYALLSQIPEQYSAVEYTELKAVVHSNEADAS